jgi:hypothetical protein
MSQSLVESVAIPAMLTEQNVPDVHARMSAWAQDRGADGAGNWFSFFLDSDCAARSPMFDQGEDVAATISCILGEHLLEAELFYVQAATIELAVHTASELNEYHLKPADLPAETGLMVYERPPVEDTARTQHDEIMMVSWGPWRDGVLVHLWGPVSEGWENGPAMLGRALGCLPREEALELALRDAKIPETILGSKETVERLFGDLLPGLRRGPIPPSFSPPHGYHWCGLRLMKFADAKEWPAEEHTELARTIVATWLHLNAGQTRRPCHPQAG